MAQLDSDQDIIIPYDGGDIFIKRIACLTEDETGVLNVDVHAASGIKCNVPRSIYLHSPTGYNFGFAGSGPADFALNICYMFCESREDAYRIHQDFKNRFIATGGADTPYLIIAKSAILDYFRERNIKTKTTHESGA